MCPWTPRFVLISAAVKGANEHGRTGIPVVRLRTLQMHVSGWCNQLILFKSVFEDPTRIATVSALIHTPLAV